jgi:hypothetical protein
MELRTHGLALTLDFSEPDSEGWMRCEVIVQVPGFSGKFQCEVLRGEWTCFRDELAKMAKHVGIPSSANLTTIEPGIELHLNMNRMGQIEGRYVLWNFDTPGQPSLSGVFELDQSYLPGLLNEVDNATR